MRLTLKDSKLTQTGADGSAGVDAAALADELRATIRGEVRFDQGSRALYATDASNYREVPIGVVIPCDLDDVVATVAVARRFGAPVLPRGGGTSLAGQCCNVAVVLDLSKYLRRPLAIDPDRRHARVEPGTIPDTLNQEAAPHHLFFPSFPATHGWCTIGGNIGNNSCGVHSVLGGRTADNVEELEVLTYDGLRMRVGQTSEDELDRIIREGGRRGDIYGRLKALRDRYADLIRERYPRVPRRVSGYNLDELLPEKGFHVARALVGTEGTCVTVLEATVRLIHRPPERSLLVLGYPDVYTAADHVPEILAHQPTATEGLDQVLIDNMRQKGLHPADVALLPEGGGWLLVEVAGETQDEASDRAQALAEALQTQRHPPTLKILTDPTEQERLWKVRESGLGATARVPGQAETWPGWEDSAVPPDQLGDYLRDLRGLYDRYGYQASLYGHFGQGCVHTRIDFDLQTGAGIRKYRAFLDEAADRVVHYGGSLSGEHGDGQARAALLGKMYGAELVEAFREFKRIWDPEWKMNPGKVVDPDPITADLRLGTTYNPIPVQTHFSFADDGGFAGATRRCVGVGKCRRESGGTMCPSFMVLREEKHTTRGRAHLLFEMLQGDAITDLWRAEQVKESLDLCLECKGCKGECPVNVDIATYKAEFLAHYYAGRLRPLHDYAFGLIADWARLAARAPGLANLVTQTPGLRDVGKAALRLAPERRLPPLAAQTFKDWFRRRGVQNAGRPQVILWPDTFNNYFLPATARAAVEVLEAAGFQVVVPERDLCCGRTVQGFGMVGVGQRWLSQILETLRPQIRAGVPLVGLEPSCLSVFRDELVNLLPNDEDARRLSQQAFLLSEFLEQQAPDYPPPRLARRAIVHGHCHHKSLMKLTDEEAVLGKMGLDVQVLDSGCCGLAGAFGFEKDKYAISMAAGERVLLPAVREAPKDALVIADGFSCREQIAHATDRRALHLAQVLQMALREGSSGPPGEYPEARYQDIGQGARPPWGTLAILGVTALVAGSAVVRPLTKRG